LRPRYHLGRKDYIKFDWPIKTPLIWGEDGLLAWGFGFTKTYEAMYGMPERTYAEEPPALAIVIASKLHHCDRCKGRTPFEYFQIRPRDKYLGIIYADLFWCGHIYQDGYPIKLCKACASTLFAGHPMFQCIADKWDIPVNHKLEKIGLSIEQVFEARRQAKKLK